MKYVKKHFLLAIVLFSLLLISCLYSSLAPSVYAVEQTIQETGVAIFNDVVGLDITKSTMTTTEHQNIGQELYMGVIPEKSVDYKLTSDRSELNVHCTFVDNKLQKLHALRNKGLPILDQSSASTIEMAKTFLSNYQSYTANSLFGELRSILDNLEDTQNTTLLSGNMKLEVTDNSEYKITTFKWTYTSNGVTAPSKFVALGFENGLLSYFVDNWQFYPVGSTTVNLSEKEAIDIALKVAKAHSWSMKLDDGALETKNFNSSNVVWTALIFDDSMNTTKTRSENCLTLYPVWRVGIQLNRWYGSLYGIQVDVWADTEEVRCVQEAWSTMLPVGEEDAGQAVSDEDSLNEQGSIVTKKAVDSSIWVPLSIFFAFSIVSPTVWINRKKLKSYSSLKLHFPRAYGILLAAILSTAIFIPIVAVNATQTKAAVIWGSRSSGAPNQPDSFSWRKHDVEIGLQDNLATEIQSRFAVCGFDNSFKGLGDNSIKNAILDRMEYMNNNFDSIVVIDFDHGIGRPDYSGDLKFHYMFEDDIGTIIGSASQNEEEPGNGVYDMDVYNNISAGKVSLAFINTCMSATVSNWEYSDPEHPEYDQTVGQQLFGDPPYQEAQGMPLAWTHRTVEKVYMTGFDITQHMSDDGYGDPDIGSQCYIGFSSGSASLMQQIPYDGGTHQYKEWVSTFFENIATNEMSVIDALDDASEDLWGHKFGYLCPLQDFTSCWWYSYGNETGSHCKMEVYGNGRIRPSHPFENMLDISAGPGGTTDPSPEEYYYDTTPTIEITAEANEHYEFDFWFKDRQYYSDEETIYVEVDGIHEVKAVFKWQTKLDISAGTGGTTDPSPGTYWYDPGTQISATAEPDAGYDFDYWIVNGTEIVPDELTIGGQLWGDTTLHANFVPIYHDVSTGSVYLYNNQYHQFPVSFYIDGEYEGPTWYTYHVTEDYHTFEVPNVPRAWPGIAIVFQYWVVNGIPYSDSNPIGLTITQDVFFLGAVYAVEEYW